MAPGNAWSQDAEPLAGFAVTSQLMAALGPMLVGRAINALRRCARSPLEITQV